MATLTSFDKQFKKDHIRYERPSKSTIIPKESKGYSFQNFLPISEEVYLEKGYNTEFDAWGSTDLWVYLKSYINGFDGGITRTHIVEMDYSESYMGLYKKAEQDAICPRNHAILYDFTTIWSNPYEVVIEMSKQYPMLTFHLKFSIELYFAGDASFKAGEIISAEFCDVKKDGDLPFREFMLSHGLKEYTPCTSCGLLITDLEKERAGCPGCRQKKM